MQELRYRHNLTIYTKGTDTGAPFLMFLSFEIFIAHSLRWLLVAIFVSGEWEGRERREWDAGFENRLDVKVWVWVLCRQAVQCSSSPCLLSSSGRHLSHRNTLTLAAMLGTDLTFTLSRALRHRMTRSSWSSPFPSSWHLEEDNCSWRICGWAPTLDKDYCRYKSWTMASLLTPK